MADSREGAIRIDVQPSSPSSFVVYAVAEVLKGELSLEVNSSKSSTSLTTPEGSTVSGAHAVCRYLCRRASSPPSSSSHGEGGGGGSMFLLYGATPLEQAEVDHWLEYSVSRMGPQQTSGSGAASLDLLLSKLDAILASRTYLVGYGATMADFAVYGALCAMKDVNLSKFQNLNRWCQFCGRQEPFKTCQEKCTLGRGGGEEKVKQADVGKYVELPGAKMGEVVVRFPPEASGYLHIGHAKAALLNQYYQLAFNGKLIMRFDDTNPEKEKVDFEEVILGDVAMLEIKPDIFSFTSDHFEAILKYAEQLVRSALAYVDDTPAEQMKKDRENRNPSANRENSIEKNLEMWEEMKAGSGCGLGCCLRAKMDMASDNGCLRDPTIYRCKLELHPRTGNKYKVYPTYDFACPIVDSLEGVTHALRTMEYHDRDPQYFWVLEKLGLREVFIYEYSRLNLQNTVLSKRRLTWFVQQGLVSGWDDPRFPTVRGVMRRGMTVEGLKQFIASQGSSRAVVMMEWDKIWACNRKVIEPISPRYTALLKEGIVPLYLSGTEVSSKTVPLHPKNPAVGEKEVWLSPEVLLEQEDALGLEEGGVATLINWGNVLLTKINRVSDGSSTRVTSLEGRLNLENTDYKNTTKLTWLPVVSSGPAPCPAPLTPTVCVHFEHIITKGVLKPEDDFKDYVNYNTQSNFEMLGDPLLRKLKKGDVVQIQRKGFYICDSPFVPQCPNTGAESPCVLFQIPDGHTPKPTNTAAGSKTKKQEVSTEGRAEAKPSPSNTPTTKKKKADGPTDPQQPSKKRALLAKEGAPPTTQATPIGPEATPPVADSIGSEGGVDGIVSAITAQGDKIRSMKSSGAEKEAVGKEVSVLLELKAQYKTLTGQEWKPASSSSSSQAHKEKKKAKEPTKKQGKQQQQQQPASAGEKKSKKKAATTPGEEDNGALDDDAGSKKVTRLGMEVKKEENFSEWYSQLITKAELIDYYDVSGCYILRPQAYSIWELIHAFFDAEIKKLGVENVYFPMFVSQAALEKEKEHIADFAPEVAWVTRSGKTDLAEPLAIRPTSETVMYPTFARWVQSHRDLPIKVNQWCSVVRWEFKHPQPFLRTREFLWQEGHTVYANKSEAEKEVLDILELYRRVYEDLLAVPVVKGRKTEKEKFAGGDYTTTIEAYIEASGRGIQAATSHHLGQNFSKMFEINFEDPNHKEEHIFAYQNSWGLTTRTIGVMAMIHGDNSGLVLPPYAASVQVIVIPCGLKSSLREEKRSALFEWCKAFVGELCEGGVRCRGDYREHYSPGWKFNNYELRGVPMRIEIGPRDVEKGEVVCVMRDGAEGGKVTISRATAVARVKEMLQRFHQRLFERAKKSLDENVVVVETWQEFCDQLEKKKLLLAPYCEEIPCEDLIKKQSAREESSEPGAPSMGAKALCIPFDQPKLVGRETKCVHPQCTNRAKSYTLFGRSY